MNDDAPDLDAIEKHAREWGDGDIAALVAEVRLLREEREAWVKVLERTAHDRSRILAVLRGRWDDTGDWIEDFANAIDALRKHDSKMGRLEKDMTDAAPDVNKKKR